MRLPGNSRYYPRPLVFLHIPKAAGSTMQEIVVRHYKGGKGYRFTGAPERYQAFTRLPEAERGSYDVMTGHVPFGIHRHLPGPCAYMTMLRDPVERIVSHYYFVLSRGDHYLHGTVKGGGLTLHDYVARRTSIELENDQTRYFIEPTGDDPRFTPITDDLVETAKRNLEERFAVVGLAERFDDSLALMRCVFGWLDVAYERKNVTPDRPAPGGVPAETIDLIRRTNRHDVSLYEFAAGLFERRIAEHGAHFEACRRAMPARPAERAGRPPGAMAVPVGGGARAS